MLGLTPHLWNSHRRTRLWFSNPSNAGASHMPGRRHIRNAGGDRPAERIGLDAWSQPS